MVSETGGRYYGPTQIDESKGERWFCSEEEARVRKQA